MLLPNFLGLGAQRAATTWIYACLREHPEVFIPEEKEIGFFRWHYGNGLDWYASHFEEHAGEPAVGEITPGYMHSMEAIRRIAADLPEVRVFVVLREPVQRSFSAYQLLHETFRGADFEATLRTCKQLVEDSLYAESLRTIYGHFDESRVRVYLYDDVVADPASLLEDLFGFLGVEPSFRPDSVGKLINNMSSEPLQKRIRRAGMGWAIDLVKRTPLGDLIRRRLVRNSQRRVTTMRSRCPEDIMNLFRRDVEEVEAMIGRDLEPWRQALRSGQEAPGDPAGAM